jgi:AcrR family transcriptional regulator
MARPRNADGQRTRQAILDAALDLFAEKGYFGTSLRDIARAVGVRESALYNYFASKDAMFDALIAVEQETKLVRLAPILDEPIADGRAALERLAVATLESFAEPRQRKLFRILLSDGIRLARIGRLNLHDRMGHGRSLSHEVMRRLVREGWLRPADPQILAIAFGSPLLMWRHLHAIDADLPMISHPRTFARQHVDQFLRGASALPSRRARGAGRAAARTVRAARRPSRSKRGTL